MVIAQWIRERRAELLKFGIVGGVAFVVDLGLYNLLAFHVGSPLAADRKVVTAKIISAAVATVVAWIGNRAWTFHDRRARTPLTELMWFGVINLAALLIGAGAVAFSTYVLGQTSQASANIAAIVGIGLGTIARYLGYRSVVFTGGSSTTSSR